jgi:hypothetical protein
MGVLRPHHALFALAQADLHEAFGRLAEVAAPLPLEVIKLLPADSDLLKALRSTYSFGIDSPFGTDPTVHLHVTNSTIGGYFVRYLVIYRL